MGISRMTKVMIAGHSSEFERFAKDLQSRSLIHPAPMEKPEFSLFSDDSKETSHGPVSKILAGLEETRKALEPYRTKTSFLATILSPPRSISREKYQAIVHTVSPESLTTECRALMSGLDTLKSESEILATALKALDAWKEVTLSLDETGTHGGIHLVLGTVDGKRKSVLNHQTLVDWEPVEGLNMVLAAYHDGVAAEAETLLSSAGFVPCPLEPGPGSPAGRYMKTRERLDQIQTDMNGIRQSLTRLADDADRMLTLVQHYRTMNQKSRIFETWLTSKHAFILSGWIRSQDRHELDRLVNDYTSVSWEELAPEKGEKPPVCLENRPLFSPFQLITRLYGHPAPQSLDPSPVLSIFFALFFGITLTDAGYGLVLVGVSLWGLWRFKGGRDILWIVFWGGLFTILAGLLTGGIFGDLFRSDHPFLPVPVLAAIRENLMWFDPMSDPMTFFRLVLALGMVHLFTGMVLGLISSIRQRRYADALVDQAAWMLLLFALLGMLFSTSACLDTALVTGDRPPLPDGVFTPCLVILGLTAGVIVLFGARDESSWFFRLFMGVLKLFVLSGIFSYLGDVLSYIRLMALGMVTAGIGMAVNAIAFFMADIPVIGMVLTVTVLVIGHGFNLLINLLGGFVHTLRLQYVEFFSKFFTGGGEPFNPLSECRDLIEVKDTPPGAGF